MAVRAGLRVLCGGGETTPSGYRVTCEGLVLNAGWPAPFLFDFPLMSFQNALGIEDRFFWYPFLANCAFYAGWLILGRSLIRDLRLAGDGAMQQALKTISGAGVFAALGFAMALATAPILREGPYYTLRFGLGVMEGVEVNCPEPTIAGGDVLVARLVPVDLYGDAQAATADILAARAGLEATAAAELAAWRDEGRKRQDCILDVSRPEEVARSKAGTERESDPVGFVIARA